MKKARSLITIVFVCLALLSCTDNNEINIPEGEYLLDGKRGFASMECGMSETTFGKTITINNNKINTNPLKGLESAQYNIKKIGTIDFLTTVFRPIAGDSMTIQFSFDSNTNELIFLCEETKIIYQKQ